MSRWWTTAGALLGALVLQVMIAPHIALFGVTPNLLLLVVITLAFVEGSSEGATVGFIAGLLMDLLSTGPIGAWALVMSVVG
ncbi:MAG: rod shape-determining protein MreD, partial [Coriobacteriia bacterium]